MKNEEAKAYDRQLAAIIDHTVLQPDLTTEEIRRQCEIARAYGFTGVCVNPVHIPLAAGLLAGSPLNICTGVGFPLGASSSLLKAVETRDAVAAGATEIDMVINIGALKEGDCATVEREIASVIEAAAGNTVKVLLEICYLSDPEIVKVCEIAVRLGAAFVKTSTGFGPSGASVAAVRLMRETVGSRCGVKAAGGIISRKQALELVQAGANRLGISRSVQVVSDLS